MVFYLDDNLRTLKGASGMLEIGWSDVKRALLAAWVILAATALYQTAVVGFAPVWLVAVIWGIAVGWMIVQFFLSSAPTDIHDENPDKLIVLGFIAGWAVIQFTGLVNTPIVVFYSFAIGALPASLSFSLDIADYMGDYRLITGCLVVTLVMGVVVLVVLSLCGVVVWTCPLSFFAGILMAVGVGYGAMWWQDVVEKGGNTRTI